jgi:hypothetical protein
MEVNMAFVFSKAEKKKAKLRLALSGPSGSGKTYSALLIAAGLGGKVAVIDTEHQSAELYADLIDYDVAPFGPPYSPARYVEAITAAEQAGYDVIVVDSLTHEWNGDGGCLDIHQRLTTTKTRGNSFTAWADVTPMHNGLINKILSSPSHIIVTMRSKTEYALVGDDGKKATPKKLGMAPIQREGMEYEFTLMLDIEQSNHYACTSKDRTGLFDGEPPFIITTDTGKALSEWLESGKAPVQVVILPEPEKAPEQAPEPSDRAKKMAIMTMTKAGIGKDDFVQTVQEITCKNPKTESLTEAEWLAVADTVRNNYKAKQEEIKNEDGN